MQGLIRDSELLRRLFKIAKRLCDKDNGHNKFLESIIVHLDIKAPRYMWQQIDTYRVGTTKQSESTMHTIMKRKLRLEDFQGVDEGIVECLNQAIDIGEFNYIKNNLPESFLQKRIVCTNYRVLRNIIKQRQNHKLQLWKDFCNEIKEQVAYPELLGI